MELSELFKIENKIEPAAGRIIISEPLSRDGFFGRSVIVMTEHNDNGSLGFILNKSTGLSVNSFISDCNDESFPVYVGGPVSTNTLHFIHTIGMKLPKSKQIKDGLFWGGDFDLLKKLINSGTITPAEVRFFVGYSGWSPSQLQGELDNNSWLVSEMPTKQIMTPDEDNLWKNSVIGTSDDYKFWLNIPSNPNWN
ncbi:MAG: transcriptional regulator [Bacteroidetes bacterium HGW-Bacteroidetes-21]|nr:MAG: transcriptional regulator [Bacteroidetes bacterium HGW-Bacteroidetes-21]